MEEPKKKQIKLEQTLGNAQRLNSSSPNVPHSQIKQKDTIIHVDQDDKQIVLSNAGNWCTIFFGELNQCDAYNLGKIVLKLILEDVPVEFTSNFTNANIAEHFPGLDAIRIQVKGQCPTSRNVVEFCTRRTLEKCVEVKHFTYAFENLNVPPALFGNPRKLENRKIFKLEFENYDAIYKEIVVRVKVYCSAIEGDISYVEASAPAMNDAIPVFDYYFLNRRKESGIDTSLTQHRSSDDAQRFFSLIKECRSYEIRPNSEHSVQDSRLLPQLLDYQKEAVVWMLFREGALGASDDDEDDSIDRLQKLISTHINKRVNLKALGNKCPQDAYYSRVSGRLSWKKESIEKLPSRGGILADEMGLGKTIEMLSLILLNPRHYAIEPNIKTIEAVDVKYSSFECPCGEDQVNREIVTCCLCGISQHYFCLGFSRTSSLEFKKKYLCPCCIQKLPTKSTLIVVPNSILKQWEEEIANNLSDNSLKIHIYNGISGGKKYIHPVVLSQYDIVLTTYQVFRKEIHFTDLNETRRLRDPKRYSALPSPLILIEWWRVCLDEAQVVENVNVSFAKLARMLPAVHRWCVTGTPIQNDLDDLYGVVCFLGIEPITDIKWWEFLIVEPFRLNNSQITIISNIFGKIFWRTEKEDVQDQLRLPRQTEVIHRLEFTPAEKYFYERRSIVWIEKFKQSIGNIERDQPISALNSIQLLPFRKLRDICTHPQLDDDAFQAVDIYCEREAKLTLTVPELVVWLAKRITAKCQKEYKLLVAACNARARRHLLKHELNDAAKQYECVIKLAGENKDRWNTDDVNLLHALINLSQVSKKLCGVLLDTTLDSKVNDLIQTLMGKKSTELYNASKAVKIEEIDGHFGSDDDAWWIRTFKYMGSPTKANLLQTFVHKFKAMIPSEFIGTLQSNVQPPLDIFAFVTNLQSILQQHLLEIHTKREEIISDWKKINETRRRDAVPSYLTLSRLDCGHVVNPTNIISINSTDPPSCALCCFNSKLSAYKSLFWRTSKDYIMNNVETMKSLTECSLDVIYQFAKKNQFPDTWLKDGERHILQFRDLQHEIELFLTWNDRINEYETTLHKLIGETVPIEDHAMNMVVSRSQRVSSIDSGSPQICLEASALYQLHQTFDDCLRELHYVKGLQTYGYSCTGSIIERNPKKCTVHHDTEKWGFLPCCHFFCAKCCSETDSNEFNCPVCSKKFSKEKTRFIDMQSETKHIVTNIPSWKITNDKIWRSPFTKVEAVIRTLKTIRKSHPNEKALVICTCDALLKVFAAEFTQNGITYIIYDKRDKACRGKLLSFRTDSTHVLLMPLSVASTGLNLTEANHVLLVEPCSNLAIEEQAIGRIYRLGQKKQTFVHRFYVADTIEEQLIRMDKEKKMSTFQEGNMTIEDLLDIFGENLPRNNVCVTKFTSLGKYSKIKK